jgi:hypothetical protein
MRYVPAACAVLCLLTMLQPSRAFSGPLNLDAIQANESSGHSYGLTISLKRLSSLPVRLGPAGRGCGSPASGFYGAHGPTAP